MDYEILIVPAIRESLSVIAAYVLEVAKQAGLNRLKSGNLRRAVDEIATNIIEHGYAQDNTGGVLKIQATVSECSLRISIEDTGIPYDPTQQEIPQDLERPLEERQIGGLGVYLARISVDQLIYERLGDRNRNIIMVVW